MGNNTYSNGTFPCHSRSNWRLKVKYEGFVVSPAPAGGRPCSPLSLAGCHFAPGLGCEEPDWRRPSPQPEPEESPSQLCPWSQAGGEVRRILLTEADDWMLVVRLQLWTSKGSAPGEQRKYLCWSGLRLLFVRILAYFNGGNILAGSYIHLAVTGWNPPGELEKDAPVQRGTRDRMEDKPAP